MNIVFGRNLVQPQRAALAIVSAFLLLGAGCSENGGLSNNQEVTNQTSGSCERSDNRSSAEAAQLTLGEAATGFICPVGTKSWYSFTVEDSAPIVEISAGIGTALTPVELTYAVYQQESDGTRGANVARARLDDIGRPQPLEALECLGAGDYLIELRDFTEENQDFNHPYELRIEGRQEPDSNEPNDSAEEATPLEDGVSVGGYIGCQGDEDWYSIDVGQGELLEVLLTSDVAGYQIYVEVFNEEGTSLAREENANSISQPTDIERYIVSSGPGTYHVMVGDISGERADLETPYELEVNLIEDIDPNEPNNHPGDATPLSETAVSCGSSWSSELSAWGTISAPGDVDWFRLPLDGCENGLIEAEIVFDTAGLSTEEEWELAAELQAELTLIRPHQESPCTEDSECNLLNQPCGNDLDCAGVNEQCDGSANACTGARVCLDEGICGANQIRRRFDCPDFLPDCTPSTDRPRENRARISAPLFGGDAVYIRASDFQSQAAQPQLRYDLRVRVRENPDSNEPNNIFTNEVDSNFPVSENQAMAQPVEVLDCTTGDCCSGSTWTRGAIAYENDMDWFSFPHPCPEEDCTLAFHFESDAGPVDIAINHYRERTIWQTLVFNEQEAHHPAASLTYGGLSADNQCLYASQHHDSEDFTYYLLVRDVQELYDEFPIVVESSRDWDPDQEYRFCIEKVSNICETPPCEINVNDNTCDAP